MNSFNFDPDAPLSSSLGYQVRETHRLLETYMQQCLVKHDIQIGMWYVLRVLWMEDGISQREISRRIGISEPTTLEQLRRMANRRLVRRVKAKGDRRKNLIYLTNDGKELREVLLAYLSELNEIAVGDIPDENMNTLVDALTTVRHNVRERLARM